MATAEATVEAEAEAEDENQLSVVAGALTYEGRIYVPADDALRGKVISLFHDNPESGHFGALKTAELVSRDFYWPTMDAYITKYVGGCEVRQRLRINDYPTSLHHRIGSTTEYIESTISCNR